MRQASVIALPWKLERAPPPFEGNAIRHPEAAIRALLTRFTKPGDKIFDPFAGLGTTLFVAEKMRRAAFGIEADRARYEWVAGQMRDWTRLVHGDAKDMGKFGLPKMDCIVTCPPFMRRTERWNPLAAGDPAKAGYETYLRQMRVIFKRLPPVMKRGATALVLAENLRGRGFTPLVADLGRAAGAALTQTDELIIQWRNAPAEHAVTHVLVFKHHG